MKRYKCNYISIIILLLTQISLSHAFEVDTPRVNNEIVSRSENQDFALDVYLRNQLGFSQGIKQGLLDTEAIEWIRDGGEFEDNALRFFHHFHNPLEPWDESGFKDLYSSSILWAQEPVGGQSLFGDWSWHDARDYFYRAVTGADEAQRQEHFANTFRAGAGGEYTGACRCRVDGAFRRTDRAQRF